jgi:chlorobactene glucosyltransferase
VIWLIISTLALVAGAALTWWLHRFQRLSMQVSPTAATAAGGGPAGPAISVIVPARNEARNIGRCVSALLAQTYTSFEVIVVDDRSTDATAEILAGLVPESDGGSRAGQLRVIAGEPLPDGWAGKPHALVQGVAAAGGEWLCFVDADTFARPVLLAAAYATAQVYHADLFSILTNQQLGTFWEKAVMPIVFSALAFGFPPRYVNDPHRPEAIANGQFILIRRSVYEAVGGHAALRESLIEDKALAEAVKRAGYRLLLADGRDLAETRMYTSLAELWEGWTKNIYLGLQGRPWLLLVGAVMSLTGALLLPGWLVVSLVWLAAGGRLPAALVCLESLLLWTLVLRARAGVARALDISPWYAITFPLGALLFASMMLVSTVRVIGGRGVVWKGRTYGNR